ncbi:MAG: hypothetical protein LUC44_07015 [Prevotellaceae bacterium]|nr:hypothetical protein [Prevotellaceae bacterium]
MRKIIIILALALCPFATVCLAQSNRDARVNYVLKNLGINSDTQKKLRPLLEAYLKEKKAASDDYNALKSKLKSNISSQTLTNDQATKLLSLKWAAESKETAVKKKYTTEFCTVLSAKKTYKCFDLLNDKKSKVQGKQKDADDED